MANERSTNSLPIYTTGLGWLVVVGCAFGALADLTTTFGYAPEDLGGIPILVAAAALVVAGMLSFGKTPRWLSIGFATLGALTTGLLLVWTLVVPLIALAFIVLFAWSALRRRPVAGLVAGA